MWTVAALYFLVSGGGSISVDHLVMGENPEHVPATLT
jgi:hypothetical protein